MKDLNNSYITRDNYAKTLGIELITVEKGYAKCELEITENHKNGIGSPHGAVIFALADIAFATACNTVPSIGIQASIKYLNKPKTNKLIAEALVVSASNKIGHYQVIITDSDGTYVAQFCSTSYSLPN